MGIIPENLKQIEQERFELRDFLSNVLCYAQATPFFSNNYGAIRCCIPHNFFVFCILQRNFSQMFSHLHATVLKISGKSSKNNLSYEAPHGTRRVVELS